MTEGEWLACMRPMLEFLRGRASERKLRLFACACVQRIAHLLDDDRSRWALRVASDYAEGRVTTEDLDRARVDAWTVEVDRDPEGFVAPIAIDNLQWWCQMTDVGDVAPSCDSRLDPVVRASWAVTLENAWASAITTASYAGAATRPYGEDLFAQVSLLRCVFGNPFRPVSLPATCRTPTAVALARAAYDESELPAGTLDPDRLAVLSDALEDAGCNSAKMLGHLRREGPHVRGCWVIDLLLGKE